MGQVGLDRPALLIMADHAEMRLPCEGLVRMGAYSTVEWCEAEPARTVGGWQSVHERAQPSYATMIGGSGHISFMDVPFLPVEPGSMMAGGLASVQLDGQRAWRIICNGLMAFFTKHLDGAQTPFLDGPSAAYPEVELGPPGELLAGREPPVPAESNGSDYPGLRGQRQS